MALAEALCAGLPVVASDVGAARDLLSETGGELVVPPFASIADVQWDSIEHYLGPDAGGYIDRLADGMRHTMVERRAPAVSAALRRQLSWRHAYGVYGHLFRWLIGGGEPHAARRWLRAHSR